MGIRIENKMENSSQRRVIAKKIMKKSIFLFLSQMGFGGQERFVSRLSEMLSDYYDVYVLLLDARVINYSITGTVIDLKVNDFSQSFFRKATATIRRCVRLHRLIKQYQPYVCISFGTGANLINILCKQRGTKVFASIRGYATAERMVKRPLDRLLYPRSDKIICVSRGIEATLRKGLPILSNKLEVLYNGYDCAQIYTASQQFCPKSIERIEGPKLVSIGTLRTEKGYWHLIKAVWILKKSYPNIHLSIVGEDSDLYSVRLKELISLLELQDNVVLEGWNSNPYVFTANSDVYVLSSVREGFPNALVEAMACGKPVVAADCLTGPREILSELPYETQAYKIEQAEYGILVPRLSIEEDYTHKIPLEDEILAEAINLLLKDPDLRRKYAEKAMRRAGEFSYAVCTKQLIKIME